MKRDDTLWKTILEDVFDDFLRFVYPNADELFDMNKGFEFLDKELEDITPVLTKENNRFVDKLVKVWMKDGSEEWIYIHIEVQGYWDSDFGERMFTYYYRIRDRYGKKITAWSIFSDPYPSYHSSVYTSHLLGTKVTYEFNTYKILAQNEEALRQNLNPFAIVIWTVLTALKKKKIEERTLVDLKLEIVKNLFRRNIEKEKVRQLMNFIRHYVRFSDENTKLFEQKLDQFQGKTYPMGTEAYLLDRAERAGVEKGVKMGVEMGVEKGVKMGVEMGVEKGVKKGVKIVATNLILNTDFSDAKIAFLVGEDEEYVKTLRAEILAED